MSERSETSSQGSGHGQDMYQLLQDLQKPGKATTNLFRSQTAIDQSGDPASSSITELLHDSGNYKLGPPVSVSNTEPQPLTNPIQGAANEIGLSSVSKLELPYTKTQESRATLLTGDSNLGLQKEQWDITTQNTVHTTSSQGVLPKVITAGTDNNSQVRHNVSVRKSSRSQKYTEKGHAYHLELSINRFRKAVSKYQNLESKCRDYLSEGKVNITDLLYWRSDLENFVLEVSEAFQRVSELNPELRSQFMSECNECLDRNRSLLFDITKCIQLIESECQRTVSERSLPKSHKGSGSHVSSQMSSKKSSSSSLKAAAAAKAAELRTKLKYIDIENEQKFKIDKIKMEQDKIKMEQDKIKMVRDLEIEEAKLNAITSIEQSDVGHSAEGSVSSGCQGSAIYKRAQRSVDTTKHVSFQTYSIPGTNVGACFDHSQLPSRPESKGNAEKPGGNLLCDSQVTEILGPGVNHIKRESATLGRRGVAVKAKSSANLDYNAPSFVPSQFVPSQFTAPANDTTNSNNHFVDHTRGISDLDHSNESNISNLIKSLHDLAITNRLPTPEPGVFSGDPLEYPSWKAAFYTLIESKNIAPLERIHYLKRYLGGKAKECVEGYFLIPSSESYAEALSLIERRFGDSFSIAQAFKSKIGSWPKISSKDSQGLRKFSDFLKQCEVASRSNPSLSVLNDDIQNHIMLSKLPDWLVSRWARQVFWCRENYHVYPAFADFVAFLVKESDIACESVFSYAGHQDEKFGDTVSSVGKTLNTSQSKLHCLFCDKNNHSLEACFKFRAIALTERKDFIKDKRLCFGCLKPGHGSKVCNWRLKCTECNRQHPTPLHGDIKVKSPSSDSKVTVDHERSKGVMADKDKQRGDKQDGTSAIQKHVSFFTRNGNISKSAMIVPVWISGAASCEEVLVYALLDTQSDTSFVSQATFHKLGVEGKDTTLSLDTMTADRCILQSKRVEGLQIRGYNSDVVIQLPTTYVHSNIPASRDNIPTPEMSEAWPYLQPMSQCLMPKGDQDIGLLIGYNCPRALAPREVIPPVGNGPFAMRTDLGWGIIGLIEAESAHVVSHFTGSSIVLRTSAKEVMASRHVHSHNGKNDGPLAELGSNFSLDDVKFMAMMKKGVHRSTDGHYELPLPIRDLSHMPQCNKPAALQRLKSLGKRFQSDSEHYKLYTSFMNDLFINGYAEEVPLACQSSKSNSTSFYLPHHGVYNPSKPGTVRVVMDASAKYRGVSLNDCLLSGPDLLNSLVGVLCRFRIEKIAVMCDIKGMFQQFRVNEEDRDWLRFLWFKDSDYNSNVIEYRSTVHLFGLVSSPAIANFALKQIASDNEDKYGTDVKHFIHHNFYMDDGLLAVATSEEAISLVHRSISLCKENGLTLHKFTSNSREVLMSLDESARAKSIKVLDLVQDSLPVERALGIRWCIESDVFKFRVVVESKPHTRRGLLSTVSSVFDPLGFIAPVILEGKKILQELCRLKTEWDEPLPDAIEIRWNKWLLELPSIERITVARCFKPVKFGRVVKSEVHYFSDACNTGYGQCTYLRQMDENHEVHCSLLMAKARVAPLKSITIPRMELTAAVLSTEIFQLLHRELQFEAEHYFWTDSQIVLGFICSDSKRYQVYVANRIQQIRNVSQPKQWHHVSTDENPADLSSRGCTGSDLSSSIWFTGPAFLWDQGLQLCETQHQVTENVVCSSELRKSSCFSVVTSNVESENLLSSLRPHSWVNVRNVLAHCFCFIDNLKNKVRRFVSVQDQQKAEKFVVRQAQLDCFSDEIESLQATNSEHRVKRSSSLLRLDPFVDGEGLLRVGGRIKHGNFSQELRNPIILPKGHFVSELIVRHCHEKYFHQGKGMTINSVRSRGFWVVGLSSHVSSLIHKCVICRKLRGSSQTQKMADLPEDRLDTGPPFTHVGLDYFGPFYITQGRREIKRYGVIITCLVSRAVHLETTCSLDSDAFINALRRFIGIRGPIRTMRCDRGTNLMGGISQLQEAADSVVDEHVRSFLLENSCDYLVNVPCASHHGGVWERQIRTVRNVLNSMLMLQGKQLDDDGLRTFFCEAANIVNSRPLTVESLSDPTTLGPLTPNHLLTMKTNVVVPPPGEFQAADAYSRKRWRRVQYLTNMFWDRWRKEYLHQLQARQKWFHEKRNLQVDDVVLVIDESLPRNLWRLGRIVEVFPGSDHLVRKVKLLMGDPSLAKNGKRVKAQKFLERPVNKLILLLESSEH